MFFPNIAKWPLSDMKDDFMISHYIYENTDVLLFYMAIYCIFVFELIEVSTRIVGGWDMLVLGAID